MNPKHTWAWAAIAAGLFVFIFFFERALRPPAPGPAPLLSNFKAAAVTSVSVQPSGRPAIRAERTNGSWLITKPRVFSALAAPIEALLTNLEQVLPRHITAGELQARARSEEEFGVDNPQTLLVLYQGNDLKQVKFGARTAPGDQVFVQVVGQEGIYIVDAELLKLLPAAAGEWRDPALIDLNHLACDRLTVSNAFGAIEFSPDFTNGGWRMNRPLPTRADSERLTVALGKLQALRVAQFVTDDPRADLEPFGLQPPAFEVGFRSGTNVTALLHFGKNPTNSAAQVFARRDSSVVLVPDVAVAAWREPLKYFRDRWLTSLPAEFSEVEVRGPEPFTLQRAGTNAWRLAGEKFSANPALVDRFLGQLAALEIIDFFKDAATDAEFGSCGLTSPVYRVMFKNPAANGTTNIVLQDISFGATRGETNYARRADENSVFALRRADVQQLPAGGWHFREPRVWDFAAADLMRLTVRTNGQTREFVRSGTNSWALGAGSQGVIETEPIEEIARQFSQLNATAWAARGAGANDARFGFTTNSLALTLELKSGPKLELQFGAESPAKYPYARVTLDGEPWAFEFSRALYQFMASYLVIAPTKP
ncbi:MAG: DUF4340 domain-containing protein [Pedosphaera sp.]|nr:DUF4340 domain-containing protein [Pedosphaera sp.]